MITAEKELPLKLAFHCKRPGNSPSHLIVR
jgi:hypothetical protein